MNDGCLDVLNCGAGHLTFRFDKESPEEVEKAKKVISDMLNRGYMLFVKVDGDQKRVRQFDAATDEYILEEPDVIPDTETPASRSDHQPKERRARVPMRRGKATAVGPTAGG